MDRGGSDGAASGKAAARELILRISGGEDFVIITPQMLTFLILRIRRVSVREVAVAVGDLMPLEMEVYLARVINTNRYTASCFRYGEILEDPITGRELRRILRRQLEGLEMDRRACFLSIVPEDIPGGEAGLALVCAEPFFRACRDSAARFVYETRDGEQTIMTLEYSVLPQGAQQRKQV
ncbi:MAG: hypothetical protein HFH80_15610 [Lachnospiraceae bacterium]|nr:hypothetical protein [Lachnospiraceae bacterium]